MKTTRKKIEEINTDNKDALRQQLIDHMQSLMPRVLQPSKKSLNKISVLEAAIDYLNGRATGDQLNEVIKANPLWKVALNDNSYTVALVNAVIEYKNNYEPEQKTNKSFSMK